MKNKIVIPDELEFKQTVILMGLEEIGTDVQSRALLTKSFFFSELQAKNGNFQAASRAAVLLTVLLSRGHLLL